MSKIPDSARLIKFRDALWGRLSTLSDSEVSREATIVLAEAIYEVAIQLAQLNSLLASRSGHAPEPPSQP